MHSYNQGKYIQSMFSENKTNQTSGNTDEQKAVNAVASYSISYIEQAVTASACAALKTYAWDIIPVCKIIDFVGTYIAKTWDLGEN